MAGKTGKARAFAFLIYPESWKTWKEDLENLHMPIVVSPLHDSDMNADGAKKKPHRHAIISWGGPASMNVALNLLEPFGIKHVEPVGSYQSYCRYLCHLDNPEKAQYSIDDVVRLSGGVPDFERKLTESELMEQRDEIMRLCEENGVDEYADLCDYARLHRPDWRRDVYMNTIFWRGFFSSKRHRLNHS